MLTAIYGGVRGDLVYFGYCSPNPSERLTCVSERLLLMYGFLILSTCCTIHVLS